MLGNAVPSLMTEMLGSEMRRQFLGDRKRLSKFKLMPPPKGDAEAGAGTTSPDQAKEGAKRLMKEQAAQINLFAEAAE